MTLLTILLLACITFTTRYLFLHPNLPLRLGPKMSMLLSFSAPAVLTAIWVPIIFIRDNTLAITPYNPYLIAATVGVIISFKTKNMYLTVGVSMLIFILLRVYFAF